jgi:uncharacterized membrane protein YoaT (DUF817 family)
MTSKLETSAKNWPALAGLIEYEQSIGNWAEKKGFFPHLVYEFVRFGIKQAWACLFGALMLVALVLTHYFYPKDANVARYDFLVIIGVSIQFMMLAFGLETLKEAKVIFVFHIVGTIMEIFKTAKGSWLYPEPSLIRIGGVPLFTGFMYAAVGSYLARVWKLFNFKFTNHPSVLSLALLALAIYINFFTHHYFWDFRLLLFAASAWLFGRCWIYFQIWKTPRTMPMLLGLFLVSLFIWFAENIGTFTSAWLYPNQIKTWSFVSINKLGSWFLLMMISYTLVVALYDGDEINSKSQVKL